MRNVAVASRVYGPDANVAVVPQFASAGSTYGNTGAPANGAAPSSPVPITTLFQNWQGSFLGAPVVWLAGLVLFLVAWKLIEEHRGGRENFSKVRVDATNEVKLVFMVLVGFIVLRFLMTKISIPGLSSVVLYGLGQG